DDVLALVLGAANDTGDDHARALSGRDRLDLFLGFRRHRLAGLLLNNHRGVAGLLVTPFAGVRDDHWFFPVAQDFHGWRHDGVGRRFFRHAGQTARAAADRRYVGATGARGGPAGGPLIRPEHQDDPEHSPGYPPAHSLSPLVSRA